MGKRSRHIESITETVPQIAGSQQPAVDAAIERHRHRPGALLPLLHDVQNQLGFVPEGAVAPIAAALNLTRADVHGVISFYHEFRITPPGRHVLKLCRAEACQAMGARDVEAHARAALGLGNDGYDTADGRFTFEPIYCLGNCALSPAMLVDGELHGRVTRRRFDELVFECTNADRTASSSPPAP